MVKFVCNKLGRDKILELCKADNIIAQHRTVTGEALRQALQRKLVEEAYEVHDTDNHQEVIVELADVLEVIDGLCKVYGISVDELLRAKEHKRQTHGGFESGLYVETFELDAHNPKVSYFRASPDKYPEIK